ncbi:hypothetical protein ACFLXY_10940 [Chloroflexota bacterium]
MTMVADSLNGIKQFKICIAGIIVEYVSDESLLLKVNESYHGFIVKSGNPDLSIIVHYGELPSLHLEKKLFDAREKGGIWALYQDKESIILTLTSPLFGLEPYKVAIFDANFTNGELYIRPTSSLEDNPGRQGYVELPCFDPTEYPLDQVVFVNLLSHGRGINLHGCGVSFGDQGVFFSGVSGAGKSTIAELWKTKTDVGLLGDDRIIIRRINNHYSMFGTPWHSDARVSLNEEAPLTAIYFLKHSKENKVISLDEADSVFRLMVRSFPTYYSKRGMEYTLDFITGLAEAIPCYELEFTPDENAIETVINHVKSLA